MGQHRFTDRRFEGWGWFVTWTVVGAAFILGWVSSLWVVLLPAALLGGIPTGRVPESPPLCVGLRQ